MPKVLFKTGYSTVLTDNHGELLGARVANDGQWRFPANDSLISQKYFTCLINFEDRYFFKHPGINPVSFFKALVRNIKNKKIVSGGSTITMQVIRLSRNNPNRSVLEKIYESILATRLEFRNSKQQILSLYANHAPFGGNLVGIQAASWRFFGRSAQNLSWSEAALLAVLPNAPAYLHVNKNRQKLINKRNRLLKTLWERHTISKSEYELSLLEPLPDKFYKLPDIVPQLCDKFNNAGRQTFVKTTLEMRLQENTNRMVSDYISQWIPNHVVNACVLIIHVPTQKVITYVSNIPKDRFTVDGQDVDLISANRSTGSILKPVLYAAMLSEGDFLPETLIPDIPTVFGGFKPENYSRGYEGAVPAKLALSRSLNVPCVRMLRDYGIPKFQNLLTGLGLTTLNKPPDHYGLTLIVGGAEAKLWDISGIYSRMAFVLNYYNQKNTYPVTIPGQTYMSDSATKFENVDLYKQLDAGSIYLTFKALLDVNRPDEESGWVQLGSSRAVAWKTGTSYGFRDAWAIGTTPEYVVGVWVGNASGEGRPGLTGVGAAAPLLFKVYSSLPQTGWFSTPFDELEKVEICSLSGYKASEYCSLKDTILCTRKGIETKTCPYHMLVHLSNDRKYRVNSSCYPVSKIINQSWFILPPAMEWYYRRKNLFYNLIPPYLNSCTAIDEVPYMEFIYPTEFVKILIPRGYDGLPGEVIFEVAHRDPKATLFWHIDDEYKTSTQNLHQFACNLKSGVHTITVVDNLGRTISRRFEIVDKDNP